LLSRRDGNHLERPKGQYGRVHLAVIRDQGASIRKGGCGQVQAVRRSQGHVTSQRQQEALCLAVGG
jgi:hypothetical protein